MNRFCLIHGDLRVRNKQCVTMVIHVSQHVGRTKTESETPTSEIIRVLLNYVAASQVSCCFRPHKLRRDPGEKKSGNLPLGVTRSVMLPEL